MQASLQGDLPDLVFVQQRAGLFLPYPQPDGLKHLPGANISVCFFSSLYLILEHADLRNNEDDYASRNPEETAANKFAAEILAPLEFLKKDFDAGIRDVKALAQRYKVSEEMMWWRIMDTGLLKRIRT